MDKEQEPVDHNIPYTDISKSNSDNWKETKENVKWEYDRKPNTTGFDMLTIFNSANKRRVYELDEKSELSYEIISFGTLRVQGKVRDYTRVPF